MGKFYTYRGTTLLSVGVCPDGDELKQGGVDGIQAGAGDPPSNLIRSVSQQATSYDLLRKREYPNYAAQLDMLWHAMDAGQIPKAQQFYNAIKKVKDKYPKGGN